MQDDARAIDIELVEENQPTENTSILADVRPNISDTRRRILESVQTLRNHLSRVIMDNAPVYYYQTVRNVMRNDTGKHLLLYPFAEYGAIWPQSTSLPLEKPALPYLLSAAVDGARISTNILWPAVFYTLLSIDYYRYCFYPDERYGNTGWNVLLGTAPSQRTLSTHFGTGVLAFPRDYWLWLSLNFLPTLALALGNVLWQLPILLRKTSIGVLENHLTNIQQHTLKALWPWSQDNHALNRAEYLVRWQLHTNGNAYERLVNAIGTVAENHTGLMQLKAIRSLAQIADSYRYSSIAELAQIIPNGGNYLKLGRNAKQKLDALAGNATHRAIRFYANYQLWTLGEAKSIQANVIFAPILLARFLLLTLTLIALARLGLALVQKSMTAAYWLGNNIDCQRMDKVWRYNPLLGDYQCGVCPDWDFVPWSQVDLAQACVTGLLAQNMAPAEIISHLLQITNHSTVTGLDFSRIDWTRWSDQDFCSVLTAAERLPFSELKFVNLSRPTFHPAYMQDGKMQCLGNFAARNLVRLWDLSNTGIGAPQVKLWLTKLPVNGTQGLILRGLALGDDGAMGVAAFVQQSPTLEQLNVAGNDIGNYGAQQLSQAASNHTALLDVDLGYNLFSQPGLDAWASALPFTLIQRLVLDGNNFAMVDLTSYMEGLTASQVKLFLVANTRLNDRHLATISSYLKRTRLVLIDASSNYGSDGGYALLIAGTRGSQVTTVILNHSYITNQGLVAMATFLPDTPIRAIYLANGRYDADGLAAIAQIWVKTALEFFDGSDNLLKDEAIIRFVEGIKQGARSIKGLVFRNNGLTARAVIALLKAVGDSLEQLDIRHNVVDESIIPILAEKVKSGLFKTLNLSENNIQDFTALIEAILHSQLEQFIVNDNPDKGSLKRLVQQLVSTIVRPETLGQKELGVDETRALQAATPQTHLKQVAMANCGLDDQAARTYCRVQPHTDIDFTMSDIASSTVTEINTETCREKPKDITGSRFGLFSSKQVSKKDSSKSISIENFFKKETEINNHQYTI